jgi:hypothetical protein
MLPFFINHSRLDITIVVRELAKCMNGADLVACKKMVIVIRFVLDNQLFCVKMTQ